MRRRIYDLDMSHPDPLYEPEVFGEFIGKVFDLVDEEGAAFASRNKILVGQGKKLLIEELISQLNAKLSFDESIKFYLRK